MAAGIGQLGTSPLPQNFRTMCSDANTSSLVILSREDSLLAAISPLFEPNYWLVAGLDKPRHSDVNSPANKNTISALATHALCADILSTYVDKNGLVDYKTLKRKRLALITVLSEYSALDPNSYASWPDADKLAFWINAHNMCIIKAVIDNYPIQPSKFKVIFHPSNSIMQIGDFWEKVDYTIMGEKYSLEEIENKILRAQFVEPRVGFALSYASLGCAPLRREPYYGRNLSEQLDDQAKIFFESEQGMKIDRDARVVSLSVVLKWFENEFLLKYPPENQFSDKKPAEAAILTYLCKHISRKDSNWLLSKIFTITYIRYNWTLNEQP